MLFIDWPFYWVGYPFRTPRLNPRQLLTILLISVDHTSVHYLTPFLQPELCRCYDISVLAVALAPSSLLKQVDESIFDGFVKFLV